MANEFELNRGLIEKMIARMTEKPEAYAQEVEIATLEDLRCQISGEDVLPRPDPVCGAAGCLIAQAIICDAPTVEHGIREMQRLGGRASTYAGDIMGLPSDAACDLFYEWKTRWPEPHRSRFAKAKTYRGQASAAVALLRAILRTDGKILEGN